MSSQLLPDSLPASFDGQKQGQFAGPIKGQLHHVVFAIDDGLQRRIEIAHRQLIVFQRLKAFAQFQMDLRFALAVGPGHLQCVDSLLVLAAPLEPNAILVLQPQIRGIEVRAAR